MPVIQEDENAIPGGPDQQVGIAIAIQIGEGGAARDVTEAFDARAHGYVLKLESAEIPIKAILPLETAEIKVGLSIRIEIADRHAGAVVEGTVLCAIDL